MGARLFLFLISAAILSLPLGPGGCGSATGGSEFGNPALTGRLPTEEPTALQASKGQTTGCRGGFTSVRAVCDGTSTDFAIGADCAFTATLSKGKSCYLQFLDTSGNVGALLSWQDPTQLNDGRSLKLTAFLKMGENQTHDLGSVTLLVPADFAPGLASRGIAFGGGAGRTIAFPDSEPVGFDANGNGVPDDNEAGFPVGSDTDGDGIPEASNETACADPGPGPLHGRLRLIASRDDLTPDELIEINKDPSIVPSHITLSGNGFATDPFPARGAWITLGEKNDTSLAVMADDQGNFTIPSVPKGVVTAKVYKDLTQTEPVMHLPLCLLQADAAAVTDATAITQNVPFPDPCTMDDTSEGQCGGAPLSDTSDAPLAVALGLAPPPKADHITCGSSNESGCCLDYNGSYWPAPARPHNFARHAAAYFGSTCEQYVDINCCVNERGTVKNLVLATAGLKNLVACWTNHRQRNCQNIDIQQSALVLSASAAVCAAHDASTNPETITVDCGSATTLCLHNNACVNHDTISLSGCGSLNPVGVIPHEVVNDIHQTERNLVYTAPGAPCSAVVTTTAWGFTRSLNINVVCSGAGTGTGGTVTSPFTPAIGKTYMPTTTGCGITDGFGVGETPEGIELNPFGSNGGEEFVPTAPGSDTADSTSEDLTIFGAVGHSCRIRILPSLAIDLTCQNKVGGSCAQSFDAEN